jgi:hypothetical protein
MYFSSPQSAERLYIPSNKDVNTALMQWVLAVQRVLFGEDVSIGMPHCPWILFSSSSSPLPRTIPKWVPH